MSTIRTLAMTVAAACLATVAAHAAQKKWTFMPIFDTSDKNRREEVRFDGGFDVSERKTWCHE